LNFLLVFARRCSRRAARFVPQCLIVVVTFTHSHRFLCAKVLSHTLTQFQCDLLAIPHHYQLRDFPPDLCSNGDLRELYLSNHKIDAWPLPDGFRLTQLKTLNVDCNRIREIDEDCLGLMVHLTTLSLAHNHLNELPDSVSALTNLLVLNVAHNDIEELPEELQVMRVHLRFETSHVPCT